MVVVVVLVCVFLCAFPVCPVWAFFLVCGWVRFGDVVLIEVERTR